MLNHQVLIKAYIQTMGLDLSANCNTFLTPCSNKLFTKPGDKICNRTHQNSFHFWHVLPLIAETEPSKNRGAFDNCGGSCVTCAHHLASGAVHLSWCSASEMCIWAPEHLSIWASGHLSIWASEQCIWAEHLSICASEQVQCICADHLASGALHLLTCMHLGLGKK
jgi:hypothetical protein